MRIRVQASGPSSAASMWEAYADPGRWSSWAPQIRGVRPLERLHLGMRGQVEGPAGVRASFEITELDEPERRWAWRVRFGPATLLIRHEVGDGWAAVDLEGPAPAVLSYAPVAKVALGRLVRLA
jgi:hypothetical protein